MKYNKYKQFENVNILKDFKALLSMTDEQIQSLSDKWEQTQKENEQIFKDNLSIRDAFLKEVIALFEKAGIKMVNRGLKIEYSPLYKKIIKDIPHAPLIPISPFYHHNSSISVDIDGLKFEFSTMNIRSLKEYHKNFIYRYNQCKKAYDLSKSILVASIEYCVKNNLDITGKSEKEIVEFTDENARNDFISKKYPEGTIISIDDNICDCETWTVGDHRCSCGNRRISLNIEGNILGYYAVPEAY